MKKSLRRAFATAATVAFVATAWPSAANAQEADTAAAAPSEVLFRNVRVFDGKNPGTSSPTNVLVRGNIIASIGPDTANPGATVIDGGGRTLMPGLIDAHTHIMFANLTSAAALTADLPYVTAVAVGEAKAMLMRGFTTIRDLGGPSIGLAKAVDDGRLDGPRIFSSGAMISQTGGHGDFRFPSDMPAEEGSLTYGERIGAAAIADSPDTIRKRVREQLALGATQIKMMAGGGVSSAYDPLDVTQYTTEELRAGVEAAENWGTYVAVHAYTPKAIRQAIDAGVKVIDHGNLIDEPTAKLMADKGIWWSLQPLTDDRPSAFKEGSPNRLKQLRVYDGTVTAYTLAKKYKMKVAFGSDALYSPVSAAMQGQMLSIVGRWFEPWEALRMATSQNAEMLALSGPRNRYGKLGVVEANAMADLILVNGDPTKDLSLVADAAKNFVVIMKDGKIYKNTVAGN